MNADGAEHHTQPCDLAELVGRANLQDKPGLVAFFERRREADMVSRITVWVIEAADLAAGDLNGAGLKVTILRRAGLSDPFVELVCGGKKAKTKSVPKNLSPCVFAKIGAHLPIGNGVWDKDTLSKNDPLGHFKLPLDRLSPSKLDAAGKPVPYDNWLPLKRSKKGEEVGAGKVHVKIVIERVDDAKHAEAYFKAVVARCEADQKPFEDLDFPPTSRSLFKDPTSEDIRISGWKRATELSDSPRLLVDGVEAGDVVQGALGDCYLLGALSVVATRDDLLLPLLTQAHAKWGVYQYVTVDDRLPVNTAGQPVYGHCKDKDELWVPIMEKAYAKLHRCYEALESGNVTSAMMDLTGEAAETFSLDSDEMTPKLQDGTFWKQLQYYVKEEYLMGCAYNIPGATPETDPGNGILVNHAYALLKAVEVKGHKLVQIRNPWGRKEWNGAWSDGSKEWTPEIKKMLNFEFGDDGTFWMSFTDWCTAYNRFHVLRLLTDQVGHVWQHTELEGFWQPGKTAGGCTNNPTWQINPQFGLKNTTEGNQVFICVSQRDARIEWKSGYTNALGFDVLRTDNWQMTKLSIKNEDFVYSSPFAPNREVAACVTLPVGDFIVLPATYHANQEGKFYLDVFAEQKVAIAEINRDKDHTFEAEWKGVTAGGCFNHLTWVDNPMFLIQPPKGCGKALARLTLVQKPAEGKDLLFVGIYVFKKFSGFPLSRAQMFSDSPVTNAAALGLDVELIEGEGPYAVMCTTFEAGEESQFQITIQSPAAIAVRAVPPPTQSRAAAPEGGAGPS